MVTHHNLYNHKLERKWKELKKYIPLQEKLYIPPFYLLLKNTTAATMIIIITIATPAISNGLTAEVVVVVVGGTLVVVVVVVVVVTMLVGINNPYWKPACKNAVPPIPYNASSQNHELDGGAETT